MSHQNVTVESATNYIHSRFRLVCLTGDGLLVLIFGSVLRLDVHLENYNIVSEWQRDICLNGIVQTFSDHFSGESTSSGSLSLKTSCVGVSCNNFYPVFLLLY